MTNARFWFVPLKDIAPAAQQAQFAAKDEVRASDLPVSSNVPSKLLQKGIRAGDVLALHDGDTVTALVRLLALDTNNLHSRRLPMLEAPDLSATSELREISASEAQQFKIGIDAILRDVPASSVAATTAFAPAKTYTPIGPASNVILYGPPGTGKTHSVRRRALELIGDVNAAKAPPTEVNAEWDRLRREGQIVFCTFHQAFAYEEFVEGLRAVTSEDGDVHYRVEPGVFKRLSERALQAWEASGTSAAADKFEWAWELLRSRLSQPITRASVHDASTKYELRVGDGGNIQWRNPAATTQSWKTVTKAHVRRYWDTRDDWGPEASRMSKARAVALVAEARASDGNHNYPPALVVYDELSRLAQVKAERDVTRRHYVLVIDEINRANIARVFGELITLLEPDKRLGNPNELRVQLPSSKEWFGVPPNLHVVGTMNTADRSIALMDVALRRRFTFEEMMPDADALSDTLAEANVDEPLRTLVVAVFTKLNERLRYLYDREHQIGHAYFFGVRSLDGLRAVFADRILPLLQEYFYGQWDKVALALGYPLKADGTPKEVRGTEHGNGTFLTTQKLDEKSVLGFDHDEYVDQVAWDVHPAFRPRGKAADAWLKQAFDELVGAKGT